MQTSLRTWSWICLSHYHIYTDDSQMHTFTTDVSFTLQAHIFNCLFASPIDVSQAPHIQQVVNYASLKPDTLTAFLISGSGTTQFPRQKSRNHLSLSCTSSPPTAKQSPVLFTVPPKLSFIITDIMPSGLTPY